MPIFTAADITRLMTTLSFGKANAIHAANLATKLGYSPIPNQEDLRALIRYAIKHGELIGSDNSGYWKPNTVAEINKVLNSLERRAQKTCDRRNYLKNYWNQTNPANQTALPDMNVKP